MNSAKAFLSVGIICLVLAGALLWERNNPNRINFSQPPNIVNNSQAKKLTPVKVTINKVKINLPVYPAKINKDKWEATTQGVSWLDSSAIPGEKGNSIFYGHNWSNLLGNLILVKPGDEIRIIYRDGSEKSFLVKNTLMVSPKNVSVLNQSSDVKITIYTCAGLFDEKRFVVIATPKNEFRAKYPNL